MFTKHTNKSRIHTAFDTSNLKDFNKAVDYRCRNSNLKENNVIVNPISVINFKGATEKDVIPSILKASIFFKGYLDSPASRAFLS